MGFVVRGAREAVLKCGLGEINHAYAPRITGGDALDELEFIESRVDLKACAQGEVHLCLFARINRLAMKRDATERLWVAAE